MKQVKNNLFILTLIAYTIAYICRLNLTATMPIMIENHVFGCDTITKLGLITSIYFVCYGVGQLFSGILSDFLHSILMLFLGLIGSSLCNISLYFWHTSSFFLVVWGLNGIFQSMIWTPILKIFVTYYTPNEQVRYLTHISIAMPLGTLLGYFVSLLILEKYSWEKVFLICGLQNTIITILIILLIFIYSKKLKKNDAEQSIKHVKMKIAFKKIFFSSFFFLLIPIAIHGALKDGMTSWTPSFLKSNFSITTRFSLLLTMIIPLFNMFGAYLARMVYHKWNNVYKSALCFFLAATIFLLFLFVFKEKNVYLSTLFIICITTFMYGANYLFISILPLFFTKYHLTGTASGILNSIAYLGTACSCFFLGYLIDDKGWNFVLLFWMLISLISCVILYCFSFFAKK